MGRSVKSVLRRGPCDLCSTEHAAQNTKYVVSTDAGGGTTARTVWLCSDCGGPFAAIVARPTPTRVPGRYKAISAIEALPDGDPLKVALQDAVRKTDRSP